MKIGPVTKINKRNKATWKKFDDNVMLVNLHAIANDHFGPIRELDSRHIACQTYIFSNSNLLFCKTENRTKKISNTGLTLLLWVRILFWPKNSDFCKKILTSAKLRGLWWFIFWNYIGMCTYVPSLKFLA